MYDFDSCVTILLAYWEKQYQYWTIYKVLDEKFKAKRLYYLLFVFFLSKNDNNEKKNVHIISHLFICLLHFSPYFCIHQLQKNDISESENQKKKTNKIRIRIRILNIPIPIKNRYICIWYTRNAKTKKKKI